MATTLFLSDSKEAINEAEQLYVMAAHLLVQGRRKSRRRTKPRPECYATLRDKLDTFAGGIWFLLENEFPFSGKVTGHPKSDSGGMQNMGRTLYFCAPQNAKLLELWDIVDDRLYKIRNCLNFEGVFRQLALFDPPIDPGLLVRAAAMGIDLGSVLGDIQAPLPAYRFTYMLQKALEICNECRSFGGALLSALEKNDAEKLAVMRSMHEVGILDLMHRVKIRQLDEANAQVDAFNASRNTALPALRLLSNSDGRLRSLCSGTGHEYSIDPVPIPAGNRCSWHSIDSGGERGVAYVNRRLCDSNRRRRLTGRRNRRSFVPQIGAHGQPMGVGATVTLGGQELGAAASSGRHGP